MKENTDSGTENDGESYNSSLIQGKECPSTQSRPLLRLPATSGMVISRIRGQFEIRLCRLTDFSVHLHFTCFPQPSRSREQNILFHTFQAALKYFLLNLIFYLFLLESLK